MPSKSKCHQLGVSVTSDLRQKRLCLTPVCLFVGSFVCHSSCIRRVKDEFGGVVFMKLIYFEANQHEQEVVFLNNADSSNSSTIIVSTTEIPYQVKQGACDRGITAENMEKSQHTDFNEDRPTT